MEMKDELPLLKCSHFQCNSSFFTVSVQFKFSRCKASHNLQAPCKVKSVDSDKVENI